MNRWMVDDGPVRGWSKTQELMVAEIEWGGGTTK